MKLTTLTFNLVNAPIRHETLQGRRYIVAPTAMLTEGVHAGSSGPLLYREDECRKAAPAWNMKPITVYHPEIAGKGVSACDPIILERQQVGMLLNTRWAGKLRCEAWIDEKRAAAVDQRVLDAIEQNKIMEVSTGLFTDNVGEPGEWEGVPYDAEATNHQPDHLALLPDRIGACSIADGAGLLQLNEAAKDGGGVDVTRLLAREMDTLRRMVGNAMSHSNIHTALSKALQDKVGDAMVWIVDIYDAFVIYEMDGDKKLYKRPYAMEDAGPMLTGGPEEVVRVTEYRTPDGAFVGNDDDPPTDERSYGMNKEDLVAALIANAATQWGEDDREALMGLDIGVLSKLAPVANADDDGDTDGKPDEDATDEGPITMEAYVAAAPPEFRDVLVNGLKAHKTAKAGLIKTITDNADNAFTPEFLETKGLEELRGIAALASSGKDKETHNPAPVPMFHGAATPAGVVTNDGEPTEAPLVAPTMNFGAEEAKA